MNRQWSDTEKTGIDSGLILRKDRNSSGLTLRKDRKRQWTDTQVKHTLAEYLPCDLEDDYVGANFLEPERVTKRFYTTSLRKIFIKAKYY